MIHELKTDPAVFDDVAAGRKTFEIRRNDRSFQVGDTLRLRRTHHTGMEMSRGAPLIYSDTEPLDVLVTHKLNGPIYGLSAEWCIMSIALPEYSDRRARNDAWILFWLCFVAVCGFGSMWSNAFDPAVVRGTAVLNMIPLVAGIIIAWIKLSATNPDRLNLREEEEED